MGLLQRLRFRYFDPGNMVWSVIDRWKPESFRTEKQYEKSLYDFLHKEFPDIQVTKQYATGRVRADIVVGEKVIIEIKNNLNTTAKYQRLIGQLTAYEEWHGQVFVVLVGETDSNLRKELDTYAKQTLDDDLDAGQKVVVIDK